MQATIAPAIPTAPDIPDKLYFRIGEVARLAGVKPYVLRFWETEFPEIAPKKSGTGHRLYRRKEVELVLEIKRLLYDRRYTIEGARKELEGRLKPSSKSTKKASKVPQGELFVVPVDVRAIRRELQEILEILT